MNDDCLVKDLSFRVHHTMLPVAGSRPVRCLLHTPTRHEGEGAARE
jgi:hypothetical protein